MVEIFGQEASGKTTLALHVIAEAQKMGKGDALVDSYLALDECFSQHLLGVALFLFVPVALTCSFHVVLFS